MEIFISMGYSRKIINAQTVLILNDYQVITQTVMFTKLSRSKTKKK